MTRTAFVSRNEASAQQYERKLSIIFASHSFWITAQLKSLALHEILPYLCIRVQESPEPWTKQSLGEAGRTTETVSGRSK